MVVALVVLGLATWGAISLLGGGAGDGLAEPGLDDAAAATGGPAPTEEPTIEPAEEPTKDAMQAAGECGLATVWASPEVYDAIRAAADRAADDCHEYAVVSRGSAAAQSALRAGDAPDVWVPSSGAWPALVGPAGPELHVGDAVASSPVLLAGTPEVVSALDGLGLGEDSTVDDLLGVYQELATSGGEVPVALRLGDPRTDAATMALLSGTELMGQELDADGRRLLVMMAQTAVQGDPVAAVRSDPRTIVPATEQQIALADDLGLQGIALAGGSGVVELPFVRVGEPGADGSVAALEQELTSEQSHEDLRALDLRPGADGAATSPEAALALARVWTVVAPQSQILALIDISGSMSDEVADGTTRIDLTRQAVQGALGVLPGQTGIGLWYFSTHLDGEGVDHHELVPLRPLDQELRPDVTHRDALFAESENLDLDLLQGDTGLHDSLWAAYQHMQQVDDPSTVASVLLLTDGVNDDPEGGLSEEEVVQLLTEARESGDGAVTVVLLGMGPDVDEAALERLAAAAGGEARILRDPRELPQVFVDIVAQRAQ